MTLALFVKILWFRDTGFGRKISSGEHLGHKQTVMKITGSRTSLVHFGKPYSFSIFYKRGFQYFTKPFVFQWDLQWNPVYKRWQSDGRDLESPCISPCVSLLRVLSRKVWKPLYNRNYPLCARGRQKIIYS